MALVCDVQYDGNQTTFLPGQVISGRVVVTLHERLLFKALSLKVSGYTIVRWEKPPKKKKQKSDKGQVEQVQVVTNNEANRIYTYREDYLSILNYYIGSEEAYERTVERGIYTYPFMVRLPDQCPSTFETALGYVRYELQVCIDYARTQEICYDRALPVQNPIDLRVDRSLMEPLEIEFPEKKSCLKFWQHALYLNVNIPQRGYVVGENISVHAKVVNAGRLPLRDIIYKFNLVGTYTGEYKNKRKVKMLRTTLAESEHSLTGRSETTVQHLDLLLIPSTPANTTQNQCKCLQIDYEVEVLVTTYKRKRFVSARLPIKIGTISMRSELREMSDPNGSIPYVQPAYSVENLGGVFVELNKRSQSMNALAVTSSASGVVVTEVKKEPYSAVSEKYVIEKEKDMYQEKKKNPSITKADMAEEKLSVYSLEDQKKSLIIIKAEIAGDIYQEKKSSSITKAEMADEKLSVYSLEDQKKSPITIKAEIVSEKSMTSSISSIESDEPTTSRNADLRFNNDLVNEKYQMVYSDVEINSTSRSYDYMSTEKK